jgi:nucleoid DNA-binding protein
MRLGLTRTEAIRAVAKLVGEIEVALRARRSVTIRHFGAFRFRQNRRAAMYDPRSKSTKRVRGGVLLRFRPAPRFARRLRRAG